MNKLAHALVYKLYCISKPNPFSMAKNFYILIKKVTVSYMIFKQSKSLREGSNQGNIS